jgi:protein-disulfide isomerase
LAALPPAGACNKLPPPPSVSSEDASTNAPATSKPSQVEDQLAPQGSTPDESEPVTEAQKKAGIPYTRFSLAVDDAPQRGPQDAPVTIVMFSDFECPFCLQGYSTIEQVEREFSGQIRLVYRAFPISRHPNAMLAALLAASANARGKFWPFHARLFSGEPLEPQRLWAEIDSLGLPRAEIEKEVDDLRYGPTVSADLRLARTYDVQSTPTFFVNGRPLAGAVPLGVFRHLVEQELRVAEQIKARSSGSGDIYTKLVEHGYRGVSVANEGEGASELDADQVYRVPIDDSPQLGSAAAPVTIVLFTDFECPYCVRGNQVIDRLRARYKDQLRLVFKNLPLPFHRAGQAAARLGIVATRHQKFWAYHDAMLHQSGPIDRHTLEAVARSLKLPSTEVQRAIADEDPAIHARIEDDLNLALMLGVNGTPSYFINGRPITGALDELGFRLVITEELARANQLIAKGMRPEDVYEYLTQTGKK